MTRYIRMSSGLIALLAIVALGALFMGRDVSAQTDFFAPCGKANLTTVDKNVSTTISGNFGIGLDPATCAPFGGVAENPPSWNSGGLITFTPPEWKVAKDADIPDGTKVGTFKSKAVLGLFNNGCQNILNVNFELLDGTIDRSNPIAPKAEGQPDRLSPMKTLVNGKVAAAVQWPKYLDNLPARNGMNLDDLIARFVGISSDVPNLTVVLNFLVFKPGATVSDELTLDPKLGYPAVTVLQDPSGTPSPNDPVTDFCAPLWTSAELLGEAGGAQFRGSPDTDGVYNFVTWVLPAPDVDEDGIENGLDPCMFTVNPGAWDPRGPFAPLGPNPGDQDGDAVPDDCDPNPTVPSPCNAGSGISNQDEDCDRWANRGDNCTLVKNEDQKDDDGDGIGNACDTGTVQTATGGTVTLSPTVANGRHLPECLVTAVTVGAGGTPAVADPKQLTPCNPSATVGGGTTGGGTTGGGTTGGGTSGGGTSGGGTSGGGVGGTSDTGIGSLAPTGSDAPMWATMLAALGVVGLVIGAGLIGSRLLGRRE